MAVFSKYIVCPEDSGGMRLSSRHDLPGESMHLACFSLKAREAGINDLIEEVFYESNSNFVIVTLKKNIDEWNPRLDVMGDIIKQTLPLVEWRGEMIGKGITLPPEPPEETGFSIKKFFPDHIQEDWKLYRVVLSVFTLFCIIVSIVFFTTH